MDKRNFIKTLGALSFSPLVSANEFSKIKHMSDKLRGFKNVIVNTPKDNHRSCGIGNVGLTNMTPSDMAKTLFKKYKIFTVAIDYANVRGCRISPNIFTTTKELDHFIGAIEEMSLS